MTSSSKFLRLVDGKLKPFNEGKSEIGPTDPHPDDDSKAMSVDDDVDEGFLASIDAKLKEATPGYVNGKKAWTDAKGKPVKGMEGVGFCPTCNGNTYVGQIGKDEKPCPTCKGSGFTAQNEGKLKEGSSDSESGSAPSGAVAQAKAPDKSGSSGSEDSGSESGSGSGSSEAEVNGKQFMEVMRRIFDNGTTIVAVTKHLAKTAKHYGADEHPEVVKAVHEILKASSTVAYNLAQLNSKLDAYIKKG